MHLYSRISSFLDNGFRYQGCQGRLAQAQFNEEEIAVYVTAITAIFPKMKFLDKPIKQLVVEGQTRIDGYDSPSILNHDIWRSILQIASDTHSDFTAKNAKRYPIVELGDLPFKYSLMESSEMIGQFPLGGWRKFYEAYPGSPGLLSLSRIGFGKEGKQALVYIAQAYGDDGGKGHLFLVKKESKGWKIQAHEVIWMWMG